MPLTGVNQHHLSRFAHKDKNDHCVKRSCIHTRCHHHVPPTESLHQHQPTTRVPAPPSTLQNHVNQSLHGTMPSQGLVSWLYTPLANRLSWPCYRLSMAMMHRAGVVASRARARASALPSRQPSGVALSGRGGCRCSWLFGQQAPGTGAETRSDQGPSLS